ncbi:hypothetical protein ACYFX5_26565 [Bremerella sp. T1]|uniref:hypothetical protein n=1 Tax=Bremerella sp. TYQ1 TaxID=3119568 RepID=UPI001CCFA6EC|nr:hypothetical protein [Bremerella volcania]UBM36574.1 hypothetical protein LA756_01415 [Bremerella volcania]
MPSLASSRHVIRTLAVGLLLAVLVLAPLHAAYAETGRVIRLPAPPDKPDHGLFLAIDTRWIDGSGYRPIRLTVTTANGRPAPADRRIDVSLIPSYYNYNNRNPFPVVTQQIKLPQGKSSADHTVLVPQQFLWNTMSVLTFEDGNKLDELSNQGFSVVSFYANGYYTEAYPSTIVFHRNAPPRDLRSNWVLEQATLEEEGKPTVELPDLRILFNEQTLPNNQQLQSHFRDSSNNTLTALDFLTRSDVAPLTDMPTTWQGLSSADFILLDREDFTTLHDKYPDRFAALHNWLVSGGNLLIWNAEQDGPQAIDQLLGHKDTDDRPQWQRMSSEDVELRDLGIFNKMRQPGNRFTAANAGTYKPLGIRNGKLVETDDRQSGKVTDPGDLLQLATRDEGFGRMLLVQENPFPGSVGSWERIFATFEGQRLAWFQRHGMSRLRENPGFWEFLIPGVGVAPVTTFELLITLFVIVIGPVNYFLLRSLGRLNFLIVTVPVGALLVTFLLMGYAFVSDGLHTQSRIRSVTLLDQHTGQGATWSRQSYYAGLASSSGLTFPLDTAIYDYEQYPLTQHTGQKRLNWGDNQVLRGGYFRSRVTQQYLAIRPFETPLKLNISSSGDQLSVQNQLGTNVLKLLVIDDKQDTFYAGNLKTDATSTLQPATPSDISDFRRTINDAGLNIPEGFDRRAYVRIDSRQHNYYIQSSNTPELYLAPPTFGQSLLERQLSDQMAKGFKALGPKSYVAIVERFPETPLGLDVRSGEKSLEVVMGKW